MSKRAKPIIRLTLSVLILSMLIAAGSESSTMRKEYVLTVQKEQLTFVAQPELGYVVKARQDAASIEVLEGILKKLTGYWNTTGTVIMH